MSLSTSLILWQNVSLLSTPLISGVNVSSIQHSAHIRGETEVPLSTPLILGRNVSLSSSPLISGRNVSSIKHLLISERNRTSIKHSPHIRAKRESIKHSSPIRAKHSTRASNATSEGKKRSDNSAISLHENVAN